MAKHYKYSIHPDFIHFPTFNFSFNAFVVGLLNLLIRLERFVRQRRLIKAAVKHTVATQDNRQIKVLQFNPAKPGQRSPAIIYFHGGAYVLTYASSHVYSVDYYAREADCTVFLVDYRLAHRAPFPTGFNDCCTALEWVVEQAAELGVDADRIALMGDSAGGGFAAGVAQWAHDNQGPALTAQLLIYPTLDRSCATPSAVEFHDVPLWNGVSNRGMWEAYLRNCSGGKIPTYAAPADRKQLTNLPPAYIETAEFDPLRDEGIAYARRLEQANVATQLNQTRYTIHGFDTVFSSPITQDSLWQRVRFVRAAFYPEEATAASLERAAPERVDRQQPPTAPTAIEAE